MASTGLMQQSAAIGGTRLSLQQPRSTRPSGRAAAVSPVAMAKRKVNTLDDAWKKGYFGTGYFSEDVEKAPVNLLRSIESKKLLSSAGKLKLLSTADKAGFGLAKLEQLKLLSTAERLGVFSLAEKVLTSDPGAITSASIPFLLAAVASLVFIPTDNLAETILHWTAFGAFFTAFGALFAGGFVVAAVQED